MNEVLTQVVRSTRRLSIAFIYASLSVRDFPGELSTTTDADWSLESNGVSRSPLDLPANPVPGIGCS